MKHKHHIIQRYKGGSDDPSNLVEVTQTQHAMWHWCEWKRTGNNYDRWAWKTLLGQSTTGIPRPEHSKKMSGQGNPMYGLRGKFHPAFGTTYTAEQRQRRSERMSGDNNPAKRPEVRQKLSGSAKKTTNHVCSYTIQFDDGRVVQITNLAKWCRENNYNKAGVNNVRVGKWRRYKNIVSVSK